MEIYEYDRAIDLARQRLAELRQDLSGLEGFSAEVARASGEFESRVASGRAKANRLGAVRNSRTAGRLAELVAQTFSSPTTCTGFAPVRSNVSQAIEQVVREIAQQDARIASLEGQRAQKVAEKAAQEAAEAAARAAGGVLGA